MGPTARWLRRFLPLLVLVTVAVGSWSAASAADQDDARNRPQVYELAPVDPVLSARRLPRALQAPLAEAALEPHVEQLLASSPPGTCLVVAVEGRPVEEHNGDLPLVPASNQKLLTTWAALQVLGPEATFRTSVATSAPRDAGVLAGDLYLVGGGDPFLWTDRWVAQFEHGADMVRTRFEALADAIVAAGITEIQGAVVGDESHFDTARIVPTWAERLLEQYQAGPLSALLVDEGMVSYPERYLSRGYYEPSPDPAAHAASVLTSLLSARGVTVGGPARTGVAPPEATELAAVTSPPVRDLVRGVNAWSNNTAAELLVKAMDRATGGPGTTAGGVGVMVTALGRAGFPVEGLVAYDGSGLDEGDRVTCELLHQVLDASEEESVLWSSLAVAGDDGTLRNRFAESAAAGQLRGKTGTLRGVTALSGYVESATEAGVSLTFSYVANAPPDGVVDSDLVRLQVPFVEALTAYPQGPSWTELAPRDPRPAG